MGQEQDTRPARPPKIAMTAPLRIPVFRRIWLASMLSNLGLLIQGVGAAWAMVQLTDRADMVALVQTALLIPIMFLSLAAGAIADMFDRRKVGIAALSLSLVSATALSVLAFADLLSPPVLLVFCFSIGTGMALFGPAWQASVAEQVPGDTLPQAVALNSISYNVARSFGPAIGGVIVAAAGAVAAFTINAILYLPLLAVLFLWKRERTPSRLPPERIGRAVQSGVRFIVHSPAIRVVLWRTLALGVTGGAASALMPLIAHDILQGTAETFGLILGAFGIGAIVGALLVSRVRDGLGTENAVTGCALVMAAAIAVVAISTHVALTIAMLVIAGAVWMIAVTLFNINIQLSAPRWVAGRVLAMFQAAIAGGVAVGSFIWGIVAQWSSVSEALLISAAAVAATALLRAGWRLPDATSDDNSPIALGDVDVALNLTGRSGPIVVEISYAIDPVEAREFYRAMQEVQRLRGRNGAYDWSLARDVSAPSQWRERFHCPTWHDYLRLRDRNTAAEMALIDAAIAFHRGAEKPAVRRWLERPFGSVRWRDDTRDSGLNGVLPINSSTG